MVENITKKLSPRPCSATIIRIPYDSLPITIQAMSGQHREREVLEYYHCWLNAFKDKSTSDQVHRDRASADDGLTVTRLSRDKSLVAFAQLICLRLGVRRALISLNTDAHEYVLAEATRSTSLVSDHQHDIGDDLWFGEATLPASEGLSYHALHPPEYTTSWSDGSQYSALALVVGDVSTHPNISVSAYAARLTRFFAAVPIVSGTRHHIGTLQILDDISRDGLSAPQVQLLQDMSVTILDHLDHLRNTSVRSHGDKMLRGLSAFVQGRSNIDSLYKEENHEANPTSSASSDGNVALMSSLTIADKQAESAHLPQSVVAQDSVNASGEEPSNTEPEMVESARLENRQAPNSDQSPEDGNVPTDQDRDSALSDINLMFTRAANILREVVDLHGVVFYSTTFAVHQGRIAPSDMYPAASTVAPEDRPDVMPHSSDSPKYSSRHSSLDSAGKVDYNPLQMHMKASSCEILGSSYGADLLSRREDVSNILELSQRDLRRLIEDYPSGKVFRFVKEEEVATVSGNTPNVDTRPVSRSTETNPRAKAVANILLRTVPDVTIAVFFPLLDHREGRRNTGCLMWCKQADSLLNVEEVLSYIEAFGYSVMAERDRLSALAAEEAKTDFIANISHELRSPLHGILGTTEFLQELIENPSHAAMVTTIETCGKTLLDTVDHVLDYAKINSLSQSSRNQRTVFRNGRSVPTQEAIVRDFDIAVLIEEVVEAIYAGQTFRSAEASQSRRNSTDNKTSQRHGDKSRPKYYRTNTKYSGDVRLSLDIKFRESWIVRSQPGGIGRIIMNLLGNALKYTDKGSILVTLQESEDEGDDKFYDPKFLALTISIKDSGRGITAEFLKNGAFTAFAQEDSFMPGMGLGLSIVQQLVHSLGGDMDLKSEKGIGTEAIVRLRLPVAKAQPSYDLLTDIASKCRGLTLCLLDPEYKLEQPSKVGQSHLSNAMEECVRSLAQDWFGMTAIKSRTVRSVDADFFVYSEPPALEYLTEYHGRHVGNSDVPLILMTPNAYETALVKTKGIHKDTNIGKIVEVISQPCGPQKMARCLYRCFEEMGSSAGKDENSVKSIGHHPNDEPGTPPLTPSLGVDTPPSPDAQGEEQTQTTSSAKITDEGADQRSPSLEPSEEQSKNLSDLQPKSEVIPQREDLIEVPQLSTNSSNTGLAILQKDNLRNALLVDDNDVNLKLLVMCAKRAKTPSVSAVNGLEAVQAYQRTSLDPNSKITHVCMDLSMPVMDGLTAVRHIRSFEKSEGLSPAKIIALTGLASDSVQREAEQIGFDAFLTKPVVLKTLIQFLQS